MWPKSHSGLFCAPKTMASQRHQCRKQPCTRCAALSAASPAFGSGAGKQKTPRRASFNRLISLRKSGAGEGIRTLDPNLGKVVLSNPTEANKNCCMSGSYHFAVGARYRLHLRFPAVHAPIRLRILDGSPASALGVSAGAGASGKRDPLSPPATPPCLLRR